MTHKELLNKYIDLDSSCLTELEKLQVRNMIYEYRETFSLRDEIGTCPNIEIDIDVMDRTPFFIRPYHVKEEDNRILDKDMKRLCYLGILKEGFSAYSCPVMLISGKVTQDKRVVTDFRCLHTRIAKNNLAYLLVKDTFTTLGNSKCEVLSVLDLKDVFIHWDCQNSQRNTVVFYHTLEVPHICIKGCLWDLMFPHQFGKPL